VNVTIERRDPDRRKERQYLFAAFALAKPKLASSSSEGWAFAFQGGVNQSDTLSSSPVSTSG
jgi:hypothetical protein